MKLFADADALPKPVKEILYRAAQKREILLILVANTELRFPQSKYITGVVVPLGPDQADKRIVEMMAEGDLVVTADIPLADRTVEKGGFALNPRGMLYTTENVKQALAMRNLGDMLRNSGVVTDGPDAFKQKDIQAFANALDRFLTRSLSI